MAAPANGLAAGPEAVSAQLLDFGQPLNVELLDACVASFYTSGSNQEVRNSLQAAWGPWLPPSHTFAQCTCR